MNDDPAYKTPCSDRGWPLTCGQSAGGARSAPAALALGGYLPNDRWYCVEQHIKMNTPGQNDGVMHAWIDGKLAFEKTDVRFRDVSDLKIENIWLNVYQGGTKPAKADQHLYIDNVVIARNYIGPAAK